MRIAQMIVARHERATWDVVDFLDETKRGSWRLRVYGNRLIMSQIKINHNAVTAFICKKAGHDFPYHFAGLLCLIQTHRNASNKNLFAGLEILAHRYRPRKPHQILRLTFFGPQPNRFPRHILLDAVAGRFHEKVFNCAFRAYFFITNFYPHKNPVFLYVLRKLGG
jgi:hypothetical protein